MTKTTAALPLQGQISKSSSPGILQRKCACGKHTMAGGECTQCAKQKRTLQRKLTIGASNDPLEREADRIADQVMTAPAQGTVSGAPVWVQSFTGSSSSQSAEVPASVEHVLASPGRPLESELREDMEGQFGYDFSPVRVHTGEAAEQSAREVRALAYTSSKDIVFGVGMYHPYDPAGRRLLIHELVHVIQQKPASPSLIIQRQESRTGTEEPQAGIVVNWSGNQISIHARIQFTGPRATQQVAQAMVEDIERTWSRRFSGGYASTCQVDYVVGGERDESRAEIRVGSGTSVADSWTEICGTMYFVYTGDPSDLIWSPAHEFAHMLCLRDRRTRSWSWPWEVQPPEVSETGYERNIMGAIPEGDYSRREELRLESRNIRDWLEQHADGWEPTREPTISSLTLTQTAFRVVSMYVYIAREYRRVGELTEEMIAVAREMRDIAQHNIEFDNQAEISEFREVMLSEGSVNPLDVDQIIELVQP